MEKLIIAAACLIAQASFAAPETKEFDSKDLNAVSVENTSGQVTISAFEGTKATVAATKNKFSDKCKMTIDRTGNKLVLKVEKTSSLFKSEECDVDFDVKVPKTVDLDLVLGSGNLSIAGIEGALVFKVGSGNMSADGAFKNINGKTGSGKVDIKGLTGGGELKTGSGTIDLKFATSPLKGEFDVKSGSGNTTILFPKGTSVKTSFKTGSGKLVNELGDNPSAPFSVSVKSGSGNLNIKTY